MILPESEGKKGKDCLRLQLPYSILRFSHKIFKTTIHCFFYTYMYYLYFRHTFTAFVRNISFLLSEMICQLQKNPWLKTKIKPQRNITRKTSHRIAKRLPTTPQTKRTSAIHPPTPPQVTQIDVKHLLTTPPRRKSQVMMIRQLEC